MAEPLQVAIVGGGFSGTMVAVQLLRRDHAVEIDLIDPRTAGRGLAYSTVWDDHLLNVPAVRMSAFGSEPMHFLDWLHANGKPGAPPDTFAPRKLFGSYIQEVLQTAIREANPKSRFRQHYSEAVDAASDGARARVLLKNGEWIYADKVVLATGNAAPATVPGAVRGYFGSPWETGAFAGLDGRRAVLLIGAGLTAVDAFLALESQGHQGPVHMVSRRGKLPHPHAFYRPLAGGAASAFAPSTARELLRGIQALADGAGRDGAEWRAAIDSLRPSTDRIWQGLSVPEQRRVYRHLKTWWDIHRHRMAPSIGARIAAARERGHLVVHAGRLQNLEPIPDGLNARVGLRAGGELTLAVARAINCSGPDQDYRRLPDPLMGALRASGLMSPNPIGRGVRTDSYGALIDGGGAASEWLLTLGPPRLGALLETTAVPELRKQAEALAAYLCEHLIVEPLEVPVELYLAAGI